MLVKRQSIHTMDMTTGPLVKKMLLFAVPLALSTLLQLLFNAADLVVVSRFAGDNAMAAVGANTSLINLLVKSVTSVAVGANVLAARERGAGERAEMQRTVHTAMALSLVCGSVLLLVGLVGADWLMQWMAIPENILDQAALYLKIYMLGMPATLIYNFGAALLRAVGDTRRPLYYLTAAGVVNVLLNLVLVVVFHLDVAGVAIATVASQVISAWLVVRCMLRDEGDIRLEVRKLHIYRDKMLSILRIGLPAGVQASVFSLSNVLIQSSINSFGEVVIAGHSAASTIQGFVHCVDTSLCSTVISFIGQNMGAKKIRRVPKVLLVALGYQAAASAVLMVLFARWGEALLGVYSQTPEVIAVGMMEFAVMVNFYVLCGCMNIMGSAMRGLGYSLTSMIVSMVGVCGFRVVWIATVFQIPQYHTYTSLMVSYPISWTASFLIHLGCWCYAIRKVKKKHAENEPEIA